MTEATTETQPSKYELLKQEVSNKISEMTLDEIAGYIVTLRFDNQRSLESVSDFRYRLRKVVDTVTEFVKDNYQDGATTDEIKELAEDCEINLTRSVKVTFTLEVSSDIEVPIDFDIEDINESDYDVSIDWRGDNQINHIETDWDFNDFEKDEE